MTFDGAGNYTLNAKATHSVNVGDNASINVGAAEKGQSAPSCLTMDSAGNIKLKGSTNIRLEIDEDTYIDLTSRLKLRLKQLQFLLLVLPVLLLVVMKELKGLEG